MKRIIPLLIVLLPALALATGAFAQEEPEGRVVQLMDSNEFGSYLVDGEGRTLYLFMSEEVHQSRQSAARMTDGVQEAAVSCAGDCLERRPAFTSENGVEAGEGIDAEMLYTAEFDGRMHVVYNGWPLFYFSGDEAAGQINGHETVSFGGQWHVINPEGLRVEAETLDSSTTNDSGGGNGQDQDVDDEGDEGAEEEGNGG